MPFVAIHTNTYKYIKDKYIKDKYIFNNIYLYKDKYISLFI